nr:unnamed protein product [Callosobruchus analis]
MLPKGHRQNNSEPVLDCTIWIVRYSSTLILGSTVSVDSFFMTSGMLVSLEFFEYVTKTGSFNIYLFYLHRYLRITLPLSTVVLFYVSLPQFLGSGPVLYDVYANHQKHCQDYWWSTLLHIQAYINPDKLCIYPIWYLSNEIPFFFLSPVILYPLWKMPSLGYSIVLVLFSFSMVSSFYFAWINKYNGEIAAPYIIGLLFGYVVFHTRNRTYNISVKSNLLLWAISAMLMTTAMFGCHVFYVPEHAYNRLESTTYLTLSRSAWTLGLAWIMWACMNGYGGMLNDFLSAHIFKALSRITYGIFLLHSIIQLYKCGTAKEPMTFSNVNAVSFLYCVKC